MCIYFGRKLYYRLKNSRSKSTKQNTEKKKSEPPTCTHRPRQPSPRHLGSAAKGSTVHVPDPELPTADISTSSEHERPDDTFSNDDPNLPCTICRQEKSAERSYRWRVITGVFLPFTLSALDLTIIASALPWIASDFGQLSQMNWIVSAFNLCSAAFIPFWGQMTDIFGRTITFSVILCFMILGSALCTAAPASAFPMLIVGRAIQGLSVAGINMCCKVILADKVSLKENAKNNSWFAVVAGISYACGPVIGGYLTNSNWRWCFGLNLPIAAAALIVLLVVLRPILLGPQPLPELEALGDRTQRFKSRISTIDYGGQFLFLSGMILIILALTWGGATYSWSDAHIIAPLVIGGILFCGFIGWQGLMTPGRYLSRKFPRQKATIPWKLLSERNMFLLFYINFATGMAITAVLYFTDIYFTLVKGYSPAKAGIQLLYYTPGIGVGVYSAIILCNKWPKQTFLPLFLGSIIEATGISVLAWALHQGHEATIFGMMGLTGVGTGLRFMPGTLHGIGFFPNNIASVVAMMQFAQPFGATLGMTIMNTVFNNKSGLNVSKVGGTAFIGTITRLSASMQDKIREGARTGVVWGFIAILPLMWFSVVAGLGLGNVNITKQRELDERGEVDYSQSVTEKPFLLEVCRRRFGKGGIAEKGNGKRDKNKEGLEMGNMLV